MLALDLHAVSLDQEKLDGLCNYMQMFLRMEASFCQTEKKKDRSHSSDVFIREITTSFFFF